MERSLNTQLEAAVEIIANKIANISNKGYTIQSKEMQQLVYEREKMYQGDIATITKIIREYGCE